MNAETVKWVEEHARIVSAFQERCTESLDRQASSLVSLLLAGAGSALAYAVSLSNGAAPLWQAAGIGASSLWLFLVAAIAVRSTLWTKPVHAPANQPANLAMTYDMDITKARALELKNHQFIIEHTRARNDQVGRWVNISRALAVATPLIFLFAAGVAAGLCARAG